MKVIKMRRIVFLLMLVFCGCAGTFNQVSFVDLTGINPWRMREEFSKKLPVEFKVFGSIVFHYRWQTFTALGYTAVDAENEAFKVSCLNPVGIKILELDVKGGQIINSFAIEQFSKQGDAATTVSQDIQRIYFNRVPKLEAIIQHKRNKIVFTQAQDEGTLRYVFAGEEKVLIEKSYYEKGRKQWSVFYYGYRTIDNKVYPQAVVLKDYRYNYKIVSRLKKVS